MAFPKLWSTRRARRVASTPVRAEENSGPGGHPFAFLPRVGIFSMELRGRMASPILFTDGCSKKKNAGLVGPALLSSFIFRFPGRMNQTPQYCFTLPELRKLLLKPDSGPQPCRPGVTFIVYFSLPRPGEPDPPVLFHLA